MLDYPLLAAVAAVVREGSFERAARALHLTPSAVSQRVKLLEERVGQVLIVRGPPASATAAGLQLCRHIEQVGMLEHELLQALPALAADHSGRITLRVAVNADSLATWFAPALAAFAAQAPVLPMDPAPTDPAEERLAQALEHTMTVERAYRAEDMSLASLATRLDVPEYRLRRLINQRLGYRNFNAYINGFRLDAVRAALLDPARRELPVLTLALDAGFQSIGPFNRAFKAATGRTPTEFRKENSADS